MSELVSTQPRTDRVRLAPPLPGGFRIEPQGAAPAVPGGARPGFVTMLTASSMLEPSGAPLVRRGRRMRDRFGGRLAGSGLLHLALLLMLSIGFTHPPGGAPREAQPVEMMFEHPGRSGLTGQPHSTPPPPQHTPVERPLPEMLPPTQVPPVTAPTSPPLPELQSPEALPLPLPEKPQPEPVLRQPSPNSSPLSHPMDLSFAQHVRPQPRRLARRQGSGGAIDLSLGPMVQNGQLLTPFASTTNIRGISSDYDQELGDWIRRHMYYPREAAERGEDGPSSVHVVLDRQGHVKTIRLVSSSGSYALDDATQGMFRGATLPPVPPDMSGKTFDVDLTIDYILIRR